MKRIPDYGIHKRHCFQIVYPENKFMGCKYGRDEDCPVKKEYPYITELRDKFADILELFADCDTFDETINEGCALNDWYCPRHKKMLDRLIKVAEEKLCQI